MSNLSDFIKQGVEAAGIVSVADSSAIWVDVDENVGIGTDSPDGTLHVHTATAGSVTAHTNADNLVVESDVSGGISILTPANVDGNLFFGSPTSPYSGTIQYDHGTAMIFKVETAEAMRIDSSGDTTLATGNLVMGTSGKGIDFSTVGGAGGMTSKVLDDYEEGSWTPVITTSGGGSGTQGTASGHYTKIGNRVYFNFAAVLSNKSGINAGGLRITGLPFTRTGNGSCVSFSEIAQLGTPGAQTLIGGSVSSAHIDMRAFELHGASVGITLNEVENTTGLYGGGNYKAS